MSDNRGWYYAEDDVGIYRASSFGSCIRSMTAARLGEPATPPGKSLQAAMDASSDAESMAVKELERQTGGTVIWQQKRVELDPRSSHTDPPVLIRGHIDGLWQEEDTIIEIKSLSQRNFDIYNTKGLSGLGWLGEKYRWQAGIYGHATQRNVRMVIFNKASLENPELDSLIIDPAMPADTFVTMDLIRARISDIERYAADDEYPDCVQGCTEWDSYGHIHIFDSPTQGDQELEDLIRQHYFLKMQVDELTMQRDVLADTIKESYGPPLNAEKPNKYTVGPFSVSIYNVHPTRFDKAALKRKYPELVEEYTISGTSYQGMKVSGAPENVTEETA